MGTTLEDKIASLSPERRAAIEVEANRLQAEYKTLQDLRKARKLTQNQLAELLGKSQVTIAQMEKRSDLLLSTLRSYIRAMGGNLDLVATFPDRDPVVLSSLFSDNSNNEEGVRL